MEQPQITRAKLIPMQGQTPVTDESQHIEVQFNPATLRVTLSNTLRADTRGGSGGSRNAAQFVDKSESSLSVELLFDTTVKWERGPQGSRQTVAEANSDVRLQTRKIAEKFMQPQDADSARPRAPLRCRFQWGRFQFSGMVSSYSETLDFFAPEGIPLRATLALTLKEDRYQFDLNESAGAAAARPLPSFTAGGSGVSASQATQTAGQDPRDWRAIATANGLENPRFTPSEGLSVLKGALGL